MGAQPSSHWSTNAEVLEPIEDFLKVVYKFNSGALTTDSKGSNTLTPVGAPAAEADGPQNYCVNFDNSQYFEINNPSADFYDTEKLSMSFWMKKVSAVVFYPMFTSTGDLPDIGEAPSIDITYGGPGTGATVSPTFNTYGTWPWDYSESWSPFTYKTLAGPLTWAHVSVTYDNTVGLYVYLNGGRSALSADKGFMQPMDILIKFGGLGTNYNSFKMGEFNFFKGHTLTQTEVDALYNSGTGAFWSP